LVKKTFLENSQLGTSIHPEEITHSLAERSVSVRLTGMSGIPQIDVTREPNNREANVADNEFLNSQKEDIISGLHIPVSALNMLSDAEFSRTVATNNLYFSQTILGIQGSFCKGVTDTAKTYVTYSGPLQTVILDILKPKKTEMPDAASNKPTYFIPELNVTDAPGTAPKNEVDTDKDYRLRIARIIASIKITLPAPEIAPKNSQLEAIAPILESITNSVLKIYPDELIGGNQSLLPALQVSRAHLTMFLIKDFMAKMGNPDNLPLMDLTDVRVMGSTDSFIARLKNIQMLIANSETIGTDPNATTDQNTGDPYGAGGGFEGGYGGDDQGAGDQGDGTGAPNDAGDTGQPTTDEGEGGPEGDDT
jgi:hypothetical protein